MSRLSTACALLSAAILLSHPAAYSQDISVIEKQVSLCVNPASPSRIARTEPERAKFQECREWSTIASVSAVVGIRDFRNCSDATVPSSKFLRAVLQTFHGRTPAIRPTARYLYDAPSRFQLRPAKENESRIDSLLVWKTMAALVVDDKNQGPGKPDLSKIKLLFPGSSNNCGELTVRTADKLAATVTNPDEFKFLHAQHPRLFWNYWIEDTQDGTEEPLTVDINKVYKFHVAFSAIDFQASRGKPQLVREVMHPDAINDYLPYFEPYKISVLTVGPFEKREGRSIRNISIRDKTLRESLSNREARSAASFRELSSSHNALYDNELSPSSEDLSFSFRALKPGCAALVVVVWSEWPRRLVTSWSKPIHAVSEDPHAESPSGCQTSTATRLMSLGALPWFDVGNDEAALGRLSYVDFGEYSIGSFQNLVDSEARPLSWVLQYPLKQGLTAFSDYVNSRVGSGNFEAKEPSRELLRILFNCEEESDSDCDGHDALREIRDLAARNDGARIQANFRDIANNDNYYLPVHLLEAAPGKLLARQVNFVQPLPTPMSPLKIQSCVSDWSTGLIVDDVPDYNTNNWRGNFLPSFLKATNHREYCKRDTLDTLRAYFEDSNLPIERPEGLLLLAHHGSGNLSDTRAREPLTQIKPEDVKRKFQDGSIALLLACSVGSLADSGTNSSRLLFKLNEKHIRAAVISPFQVPSKLARRFLENMKVVISKSEADMTLSSLLEKTKLQLQTGGDIEDDNQSLQEAVDIFMVVGNGDVRVCGARSAR